MSCDTGQSCSLSCTLLPSRERNWAAVPSRSCHMDHQPSKWLLNRLSGFHPVSRLSRTYSHGRGQCSCVAY